MRRTVAIPALMAVVLTACGGGADAPSRTVDGSLRLEGSAATLDELGTGVLGALATGDTEALERFRLTEHQHNETVWPELPASAPEVNFPLDYAWQNIENRNRRALSRLVPLFSGRTPALQDVECRGETEVFDTFEVQTDCWLVFTDGTGPRSWEVQAFKDVLYRGGGLKVFRYYDEEPRPYGASARG